MNREIEFRGKCLYEGVKGQWKYGSLINCNSGRAYILETGESANESIRVGMEGCLAIFTFEVDPKTVGQYTGKKDKNGMKIFEGDIAKANYNIYHHAQLHFPARYEEFKDAVCEVYYDHFQSAYMLKNPCSLFAGRLMFTHCDIEVIGNVHDNPELLEEIK